MRPHPAGGADADAAFSDFFRATYPDVLAFLRRRVEAHDAEDLAAEVFAIAWDTWDRAPRERRPWVFGVARNVAAGSLRARGRRQRLELRAATATLPSADETPTVGLDLRLAWSRLSDGDREALALVAWDGLTGREAAQVLGCTRAAFSVRLTRARRRLRAMVDDVDTAGAAVPSSARFPGTMLAEGDRP
ncbi:RNA polymerase sigma factor [Cellulomonas sp. PhB143]|uniref:RNA polymerase sigma factor n=1 Tax=Cellulomonas sp. PhB143 TaxID=2485186 RepID=UPI000F4A1FD3|nr:sigma-70 family RNA polymerase sigma factor [Cellulomonas sp. PhB143]ROS72086.1 RNA polymerase sigma-70 factor (ECF subfamily) [Cellulomonas sp. PhB143]